MDDFDFYLRLVNLLAGAAAQVVIKADELTIGLHPAADLAEEGEIAVLDWAQTGGPIVAQLDDAAPLIIERCGQVRTIGAILAAVELDAPADLDLLAGIATGARCVEENTPGGPTDPLLRLGLAARAVALDALGMPGEIDDRISRRRDAGIRGLDGRDFDTYTLIAFLGLTGPDKAALEQRAAA